MGRLLVVVATAIAAVVVTSVWMHRTNWAGWHMSECGFDSHGLPYAAVTDNTVGGAKHEDVRVYFLKSPDEKPRDEYATSRVHLPVILGHAFGSTSTVVHGTHPKQNGSQKVYCVFAGHGNNDFN